MTKKKPNPLLVVFGEKVRRIAKLRGLSDGSASYLTQLLIQKTRSENAPVPATLFDMYREALEADGGVAASRFKALGDQALFILGVFPESLKRRGVSAAYYSDMGSGAYSQAASLVGRGGVLVELAKGFSHATWTFRDVFEEFRLETSDDVLGLYAEWERTGSLRVLRRLQELGFHLLPGGGK